MHKFFTEDVREGIAVITGEDVKHAWKVLRLRTSDRVEINDLKGNEFIGEIENIDKSEVRVRITENLEKGNESPVEISLYQGIPKGQKMELICQKAVEMGVSSVHPLITGRIVPDAQGEYRKLDRLRRIILEASKQAKRSRIMEITEPVDLKSICNDIADLIIVPYENEEGRGIRSIENRIGESSSIAIVIGPEGGFEEEEIEYLRSQGAEIVTLGPRILRTETAGLAASAIIQYLRGDMGGYE